MVRYYQQCRAFKDDYTQCKCREGVNDIRLNSQGFCKFHTAPKFKYEPNQRGRDCDVKRYTPMLSLEPVEPVLSLHPSTPCRFPDEKPSLGLSQ